MLQHDENRELRRRFLLTCVQRNRNQQLRIKALTEIAQLREPEAFDDAIDTVGTWSRDDRRAGTRVMLEALAERRIGRRDQAQAWVWRLADYTRDLHEEYAVQRWPETKRLLGLLVNSSGRAHGRNARRLVHAARNQDRRLAAALLAAGVAHTPEGEEVLRGARMRAARKPSAVARELLRNFPKAGGGRRRRRKRKSKDGAKANGANGASSRKSRGARAKKSDSGNGAKPEAKAPRAEDRGRRGLRGDARAELAAQQPRARSWRRIFRFLFLVFAFFSLARSVAQSGFNVAVGVAVTEKLRAAAVRSGSPPGSSARTWKVWDPTESGPTDCGEAQAVNAAASSEHWKVDPGSFDVKPKTTVELVVVEPSAGPAVIVVSGLPRKSWLSQPSSVSTPGRRWSPSLPRFRSPPCRSRCRGSARRPVRQVRLRCRCRRGR